MIDSYRFGWITVDGVEYTKDLIILPNRVKSDWWRVECHRLRARRLLVSGTESWDVIPLR